MDEGCGARAESRSEERFAVGQNTLEEPCFCSLLRQYWATVSFRH
jgi:hypothetical protein